MELINATDPLVSLPGDAGILGPAQIRELLEDGDNLSGNWTPTRTGDVAPLVYARRRDGAGGVLLQPTVSEARFETGANNALVMYLELVLAGGQIGQLQANDVRQGPCLVGSLQQTFNRRAGTWTAGNVMSVPATAEQQWEDVPVYCGTPGSYAGLSTASFTHTYPTYDERWTRQINLFCRAGHSVSRLFDGASGSTDNWADIFVDILRRSRQVPDDQLDLVGLAEVAKFLELNNLRCNVKITEQRDLADYLDNTSKKFLCHLTYPEGRLGLRPLLPVTANGEISLAPVQAVATFTTNNITEYQDEYVKDRTSSLIVVKYRKQTEADGSIYPTVTVGYNDAITSNAPTKEYDISDVCTSEIHAVKFAAYEAARARHITHTARLKVAPGLHDNTVKPGDVVAVLWQGESSIGPAAGVNSYYEVSRINPLTDGSTYYDLIHYPIDSLKRSVVAVAVARAVGSGYSFTIQRDNTSCNINDPNDSSLVPDVGGGVFPDIGNFVIPIGDENNFDGFTYDPGLNDWFDSNGDKIKEGWEYENGLWNPSGSGSGGDGSSGDGLDDDEIEDAEEDNEDPIDGQELATPGTEDNGPEVGSALTAPVPPCQGGFIEWQATTPYLEKIAWELVGQANTYFVRDTDGGKLFRYIVQCPGQDPLPSLPIQAGTQSITNPVHPSGKIYYHIRSTNVQCVNGVATTVEDVRKNVTNHPVGDPQGGYTIDKLVNTVGCNAGCNDPDPTGGCPNGSYKGRKWALMNLKKNGADIRTLGGDFRVVGSEPIQYFIWATDGPMP